MTQAQASTAAPSDATGAQDGNTATPISARILKKRETDRRCQRMIRERTKSRIAYLEGLVEQFRQQDASGRVETLMKQLQEVKEDRDSLAKQVKSIESIVAGTKLKEDPDAQDTALVRLQSTNSARKSYLSIDTQLPYRRSPSSDDLATASPHDGPIYTIHNREYQQYVESSSRSSWAASTLQPGMNQTCECSAHYSAVDPSRTLNKWRYANDTLTEWFKWSPQALDVSKYAPYNDDIPVRAVVEGWDAVERHGHMHPAWRLLKGIDQTIFVSCNPLERLAILQVMSWLLFAHMNPTTEQQKKLPSFYLKRPSQDMLHSYATEYFAWPGLRERFIFSEHRYCTNIFWQLFCKSMHFQWPYEFRDCYVRNTDTGLYRVSPTFHERMNDIRCWTMGMDIFKQYPELYGDIPACNHIPASIASTTPSRRPVRGALPSTKAIEDANAQNDTNRPDPNQGQSITPMHDQSQHHQVHTQSPSYPQYPASVPNSSFDASSALSHYEFPNPGLMTTLPEIPHVAAVQDWNYQGSLDMFHIPPG